MTTAATNEPALPAWANESTDWYQGKRQPVRFITGCVAVLNQTLDINATQYGSGEIVDVILDLSAITETPCDADELLDVLAALDSYAGRLRGAVETLRTQQAVQQ